MPESLHGDYRAFGVARSPQWPAVRRAHLAANPQCAACGRSTNLEVHHIEPFHVAPDKELDPANLLTLCDYPGASCHLLLGHFGNWTMWNPHAVKWAGSYRIAKEAAQKRVHAAPEMRPLLAIPDAPPSPEIAPLLPSWMPGSGHEVARGLIGAIILGTLALLFAYITK